MSTNNIGTKQPLWVWFDPTTKCNLACRLCYTKQSHGELEMTTGDFRIMLKKLNNAPSIDLQKMHLNWRGEPLMNSRFSEFINVMKNEAPNVDFQWHTNGTLLSESVVKDILAVGHPHKIFVSIDGGNASRHDKNRGKGKFRRTIKGLNNLLRTNKGNDCIKVGVYEIDLNTPVNEYDPQLLALLNEVDAYIKVKPLLPLGAERSIGTIEDLADDEALAKFVNAEIAPNEPIPAGPCFWAGNSIAVDPKGNVSVCILSHKPSGYLGNLLEESAEEIIARANKFRQELTKKTRAKVSHCATCRKPHGQAFQ